MPYLHRSYKKKTKSTRSKSPRRGGTRTLSELRSERAGPSAGLRPLKGTQTERLHPSNTIEFVQARVQEQEGIPPNHKRLIFPGQPLNAIEKTENFIDLVNEITEKPTDPFEPGKTITDLTILTKASPEFQTRIQNAPYLKNIKPKIENYHFQYLLEVLRNFTYADSHKAYIDSTLTKWCYVFTLSQVLAWLQREIDNIRVTKESLGYAFTDKDSEVIIAELRSYMDYFDANQTSWDRLNTQYLEVLFDDIRD